MLNNLRSARSRPELILLLSAVAVLLCDGLEQAVADDPVQGWACAPTTNTCEGFDGWNCLGSWCSDCSSGCPTSNLPAWECTPGGIAVSCAPTYTSCGNFYTETIQPCNPVCVCDVWTYYSARCPGAIQSGCALAF